MISTSRLSHRRWTHRLLFSVAQMALLGCSNDHATQDGEQTSQMDIDIDADTDNRNSHDPGSTSTRDSDTCEETDEARDDNPDSSSNSSSSACAQGADPYQIPKGTNALADQGCKRTIEIQGDEVDVFIPIHHGPFPVLIVMQGAKVDKSFYSRFARYVSSYGIIVAVPNHSSILGKHFTEQKVFNNVWKALQDESGDAQSPFFGKVDTESVSVVGHSFGGTVAMNLAQNKCEFPSCSGNLKSPQELKAAIFYGFNNVNPVTGASSPISNIAPVLLIAGELNDPKKVEKTYDKVENNPKFFLLVKGANHYGITDTNNPEGAKADTETPLVEQEDAIRAIADWSGLFIRAYLHNDPDALKVLSNHGSNDDNRVEVKGTLSR